MHIIKTLLDFDNIRSRGTHSVAVIDRFSRDKYDSAHDKRILKKNQVRLTSVLENLRFHFLFYRPSYVDKVIIFQDHVEVLFKLDAGRCAYRTICRRCGQERAISPRQRCRVPQKGACHRISVAKLLFVFVDLAYGGEAWLSKSTIRRRVMLRLFGEVA